MTLPPPMPPKKPGGVLPPGSPAGSKPGGKSPIVRPEDIKPASKIPIVISIASLFVSALLAFVFWNSSNLLVAIVGYLLTPFLIILMSGVDSVWQRKSEASKPWFLPKPRYATVLRLLSGASLILAYFHISVIAEYLSIQLGKII